MSKMCMCIAYAQHTRCKIESKPNTHHMDFVKGERKKEEDENLNDLH
jgi:hypothetical protein